MVGVENGYTGTTPYLIQCIKFIYTIVEILNDVAEGMYVQEFISNSKLGIKVL